jgi:S-DNA-T family DNA segregation ATPase FtsK/SpoIIIE
LQRALGIGYGRAARLVDFMAEDGIVGEYNGSQAREVLLSLAEWEKMQGQEVDPATASPSKPRRSNVIRRESEEWELAESQVLDIATAAQELENEEDVADEDAEGEPARDEELDEVGADDDSAYEDERGDEDEEDEEDESEEDKDEDDEDDEYDSEDEDVEEELAPVPKRRRR